MQAEDDFIFQFATDGEGNYGYLGADDSFIPFKGTMTVKAQKNQNLDYTGPVSGTASLSYTVQKECSAVLICAHCCPSTYGFSSNSASCKINGVEQVCNILGNNVVWWSTRITFVEKLHAGDVIELAVSGACDTRTYGQLAVAVITNE